MAPSLSHLVITCPLSPAKLAELRPHFDTVYHHPPNLRPSADVEENPGKGDVPKDVARKADVWYCNYLGIPEYLKYEDIAATRVVQLTSAGANLALQSPALKDPEARKRIAICSASGIHSLSIPQWILSQTISLYQYLYLRTFNMRTTGKWDRTIPQIPAQPGSFGQSGRSLYGKTAGLLGYGHIARETARLLKAFNVQVIAANSSGEKRPDDGYIIPGTGDEAGTIPSAYYSTSDPESFKTFLSKSDILIASLPSTPQTTYMLKQEHFDALPSDAVFINVGRGDLVKSDILLAALDKGHLSGAALDVTDPEPLPDNHPLFTHPKVIVTPHTSSSVAGYFELGADLLLENVRRIREGGKPINKVDPEKGY
ncbi:hypothetical protein IAU60_001940 [Kwoniella sp. DSM 27419]